MNFEGMDSVRKYFTSQPRGIITLSRIYKLTTVIVQTEVPSSARPNQGPRAGRNACDWVQSVFGLREIEK